MRSSAPACRRSLLSASRRMHCIRRLFFACGSGADLAARPLRGGAGAVPRGRGQRHHHSPLGCSRVGSGVGVQLHRICGCDGLYIAAVARPAGLPHGGGRPPTDREPQYGDPARVAGAAIRCACRRPYLHERHQARGEAAPFARVDRGGCVQGFRRQHAYGRASYIQLLGRQGHERHVAIWLYLYGKDA